jgi:hypothetical protein
MKNALNRMVKKKEHEDTLKEWLIEEMVKA